MKVIGVRELRQRASEFLRDVEKGEVVEVTAHGRPVARVVPVRQADRRARLIAAGRLLAGRGDVLGLGAPLPAAPRAGSASRALARARASER
jgi:prevent-host-death family protein